jgi:hypothetical protein
VKHTNITQTDEKATTSPLGDDVTTLTARTHCRELDLNTLDS